MVGGSAINAQFFVTGNLADSVVFEESSQTSASEDPTDQMNLKFLAFVAVLLASIADGLYYSLSMLKFGCEVDTESFSGIAGDSKFDNLTNNWGNHKAILIAFLTLIPTTVLLSILGAKKLNLSEKVQKLWPYIRSALSGLKNGRKAVVSTAFIAQAFAHSTRFYKWANPIGIGIGLVCMANALWLRRMEEERESSIRANQATVEKIQAENLEDRPIAIRHSRLKQTAICSAVFGDGLTDGIYLYACLFGVIGLSTAVFPPALLIVATVTVVVLTTFSIISKLNAEYKKSCELELSAVNVDIAYLEKKQKLNSAEFSQEDANELQSLKEKQSKLSEIVNKDNKSFLFSAGRQTVMGFKNAAAAGAVLLMIPGVALVAETSFILAKVAGFFYALFLAGEEVKKYNESTKKSKDLNATENKEPINSKASAKTSFSIMDSVKNLFFSPKPKIESKPKKITVSPQTDFFSKKIKNNTIPLTIRPLSFTVSNHTPIPCAC